MASRCGRGHIPACPVWLRWVHFGRNGSFGHRCTVGLYTDGARAAVGLYSDDALATIGLCTSGVRAVDAKEGNVLLVLLCGCGHVVMLALHEGLLVL